ncbi:NDP-hexose 2,3-dehydratase family protein [Peterkaempfera bronchialis]|uniref:NDP-hexose 2,3-dehydratase family protein n=1 Tax=Peterkaempfera bronchialis TaxID=2126346 RepID=UPI003C2DE347
MNEVGLPKLLRRPDRALLSRLADSAAATDGAVTTNEQFLDWLSRRWWAHAQQVRPTRLDRMADWYVEPRTGDLRHTSGRFFSVEGLRVRRGDGPVPDWDQPVIVQPEIGLLGLLVREIGGLLHLLMQAKAEPGNLGGIQLAPTVQATPSNYDRVHGGAAVPYVGHFLAPAPERVVAEVPLPGPGPWLAQGRNRALVVEAGPEVGAGPDFCWLTLGQVNALLRQPNLVSADARTVLSTLPDWHVDADTSDADTSDADDPYAAAETDRWIARCGAAHQATVERTALSRVAGWNPSPSGLADRSGLLFDIVAVDVRSARREVPAWSQPLLRPHRPGTAALLVKEVGGVPRLLLGAHPDPDRPGRVALGPTVRSTPDPYTDPRTPCLDAVHHAPPERVLFDTELSEEGSRFHHARTRHLVIDASALPDGADGRHHWVSLPGLHRLLDRGHRLDAEARTLLAALRAVR